MTKKIDTTDFIPEEIAALGRESVSRWQSGMGQSARMNRDAYRSWYDYLFELALASFKWEGLPEEMDPRFIEYVLLTQGIGGFFRMKEGTAFYAFAAATPVGNLNLYYNPNKIMLQSPNGGLPWYRHAYYFLRGDVLYEPDAVPVWNSYGRKPFVPVIRYYARRLAMLDRTVDTNILAQQTPFVITTTKDTQRDAQKVATQLMGHAATITISDKFGELNAVNVLNTNAPYVADKLLADKNKILDAYLAMCGIDNSNTEKRERVSDREASSNNEQIILMRNSRLRCREEFCERVAVFTRGEITPSVKYAAPYREDGTVDMSAGGIRNA